MSRLKRNVNIAAVVVPFLGFLAAVILLWNRAIGASTLAIMAVIYFFSALGVTVGFHRMLTHRAFETHRWIKYLFAAMGSIAVQGPVIGWVADHRKHHANADQEGDPHTPHGFGDDLSGTIRGLWHAHVGWLWTNQNGADPRKYAVELWEDRGMRFINRHFLWFALAPFPLAFGLGWWLGGTAVDGLWATLWGGLVRLFLLHHVTWSINSICHVFGRRRFDTDDLSTNVFWLALPSLGEAWHHNHHAFPRSASHGLRWWEIDVSALVIRAMRRLGLAWNVTLISPERQSQRLAPPAGRRTARAGSSA